MNSSTSIIGIRALWLLCFIPVIFLYEIYQELPEVKTFQSATINFNTSEEVVKHSHVSSSSTFQVHPVLINFAIIGFPKCSTTFLRNQLINTPRFFYGNDDTEIHLLRTNDVETFKDLFATNLTNDPSMIKGFKCPDVLYSEIALSNLESHFPRTDFIVSIRHPILWFSSFYNYRIRKGYRLPNPNSLIGICPSQGEEVLLRPSNDSQSSYGSHAAQHLTVNAHKVCTDRANFHVALSRLGKTPMDTEKELTLLHHHNLKIHHYPNKVFLFEIGQLSVQNRSKADTFVKDLESFLGLNETNDIHNDTANQYNHLPHLKRHDPPHRVASNVNLQDVEKRVIDICSSEFDEVRSILLEIGKEASIWIRRYLIKSPDVVVPDVKHFKSLLRSWEIDPCTEK